MRARAKPVVTVIDRSEYTRRPRRDVFAFFDRPSNLKRVTPSTLAVTMERHPDDLRPGTIFGYRLTRWPVDVAWEVVVSEYRPPSRFTNVKSTGYFPKWAQTHELVARDEGTELRMSLEYEVPSGLYASLSNTYLIRQAMEELMTEQIRAIREALDRGE